MKSQFFSLILLLSSVNAGFSYIKPRLSFSSGSNGYEAMSASVRFGNSFYLQPGYRTYSTNSVPGTFETYSARVGYDASSWGLGFEGGYSPENNDYKNAFAGADTWFEFPLMGGMEAEAKDQLLMEIGVGVMGTRHTDQLQALDNGGGGSGNNARGESPDVRGLRRGEDDEPTVRRGSALSITQTDLSTSLGLSFFSLFAVDGEYSKSIYDKDLAAISARDLQLGEFEGVSAPVRGYRQSSITTRLSLLLLPKLTPYISHSRINFELDDPTATSNTLGCALTLKPFRFDVAFETYDSGGNSSKSHTTTIGGSVRF